MLEQHQKSNMILRNSTQLQSKALYDKLIANAVNKGDKGEGEGEGEGEGRKLDGWVTDL